MVLLVTGGAGFIGSHFIRTTLAAMPGARIINLDSLSYAGSTTNVEDVKERLGGSRYFFVKGDICNGELVQAVCEGGRSKHWVGDLPAPAWIINFAAETHVDRSIDDDSDFVRTNVMGVRTLLEAARHQRLGERGGGFLQVSTDEVYGALGEEGRFSEADPMEPNSPYAATKAGAEHLVRAYHRTFGLPVRTVRGANNYGPRQYPEKFLPVIITKALRNEPLPIYGTGRNVRDWLYVEDFCQAIRAVVLYGKDGETYNAGSSEEVRNIDLSRRILAKLGKPESLIEFVSDRPGHDWRYAMDSSKLQGLGWRPQVALEDGLDKTIEWYVSQS
jgi:dTDP-glucose 4,6-dehydratase